MPQKLYRILQTNLNHSARAQDLLMQAMAEWNIDVGIVAEPYSVPQDRSNWTGDVEGSVAIIVRRYDTNSPLIPLTVIGKGNGFIAAKWGETVIVGVYFSPNKSLATFEQFLDRMEIVIRRSMPGKIIIAGDWNAKSTLWGSQITDAKGEALGDWITSLGLECQNKGTIQTCIRKQGGSVVDVTFATPAAARLISNWWVEERVETLFDHKYVRIDISTSAIRPRDLMGHLVRNTQRPLRWALEETR